MSWAALLQLIADDLGAEAAARIEARARRELGGVRITISKRPVITAETINEIAPGKPKEAAAKLGVHPATVYRALQRRIVR